MDASAIHRTKVQSKPEPSLLDTLAALEKERRDLIQLKTTYECFAYPREEIDKCAGEIAVLSTNIQNTIEEMRYINTVGPGYLDPLTKTTGTTWTYHMGPPAYTSSALPNGGIECIYSTHMRLELDMKTYATIDIERTTKHTVHMEVVHDRTEVFPDMVGSAAHPHLDGLMATPDVFLDMYRLQKYEKGIRHFDDLEVERGILDKYSYGVLHVEDMRAATILRGT